MQTDGQVRSHSNPEQYEKKNGFEYKTGDKVTVEVDLEAGKITYSLVGGQKQFCQTIRKQHIQPGQLYFAVDLGINSKATVMK